MEELFAEIVGGWKRLKIFSKRSIIDLLPGSKYASEFIDGSLEAFNKGFLVLDFSLPFELVK